jgi:hypothetical protein
MRVLHTKRQWKLSKLVILCMGLTSIAVIIGGILTGNVILIGAGAAGTFLMCGGALGLRERQHPSLV